MTITNISDVERELRAEIARLKEWAKLGLAALEYASTGNRRAELIAPAIAAFKQALAEKPAQQQEPDANTVKFTLNHDMTEMLRLDREGFHYNGQVIKDAGEAYRLFNEWLAKANASAQRKSPTRATIADARDYLNTNDKAMWVLGWNECVEAHSIKEQP